MKSLLRSISSFYRAEINTKGGYDPKLKSKISLFVRLNFAQISIEDSEHLENALIAVVSASTSFLSLRTQYQEL
jgi:hypothetical protein